MYAKYGIIKVTWLTSIKQEKINLANKYKIGQEKKDEKIIKNEFTITGK